MYITALFQSYSSKKILNIKMIQKIKLHVKKKTLKDMKTKELQRNRFQYSTADDKEYEQFSGVTIFLHFTAKLVIQEEE